LGTGTDTPVVSDISKTYMFNTNKVDPSGNPATDGTNGYVQFIYTFELLSALLDSAPTATSSSNNNIFQIAVKVSAPDGSQYIIDAMIQTKGNSALSPTYTTKVSGGFVYFPVTNFFTVSSPGAPYTLTITMTQKLTANIA
jgi:hypothetical protein